MRTQAPITADDILAGAKAIILHNTGRPWIPNRLHVQLAVEVVERTAAVDKRFNVVILPEGSQIQATKSFLTTYRQMTFGALEAGSHVMDHHDQALRSMRRWRAIAFVFILAAAIRVAMLALR